MYREITNGDARRIYETTGDSSLHVLLAVVRWVTPYVRQIKENPRDKMGELIASHRPGVTRKSTEMKLKEGSSGVSHNFLPISQHKNNLNKLPRNLAKASRLLIS